MSGLLVKSAGVMGENLAVLRQRGIDVPVIVGGAALTRRFVEQDLRPQYSGPVLYAKDAFAGLSLMDSIVARKSGRPTVLAAGFVAELETGTSGTARAAPPIPSTTAARPEEPSRAKSGFVAPQSDISRDKPVPQPPFWGSRVVHDIVWARSWHTSTRRCFFRYSGDSGVGSARRKSSTSTWRATCAPSSQGLCTL